MTTTQMAEMIAGTPRGFAPPEALAEARRSFLNWLGVAVGATQHPMIDMALAVADLRGGHEQATVLGRRRRADLLTATLVNGMSSHIFDYDDTFLDTILHPSAPVVPAALAWSEWQSLSGIELLESIILGIEVAQRVAQVVYPSHYDRGWHITGSVGAFGAAAAAGWLMQLDAGRLGNALGLAATQPLGLREMFGTHTKPYHPGKAAANGLEAALLAAQGFVSSARAIEAPRGFAHVTSEQPRLERLTDGWGESWQILSNSYKPFPCGVVIHPIIDGVARLRSEKGIKAPDVVRLQLRVHPLVLELTGKTEPRDGLEAKFSVYHCAAVTLLDGWAGLAQFADERVTAADVIDLRARVQPTVDSSIAEDQVHVTATLRDGSQAHVWVEHCLGSKDNPMSDDQLERKFREVAGLVLPAERTEQLIASVAGLATAPTVGRLVHLATPPEVRSDG